MVDTPGPHPYDELFALMEPPAPRCGRCGSPCGPGECHCPAVCLLGHLAEALERRHEVVAGPAVAEPVA